MSLRIAFSVCGDCIQVDIPRLCAHGAASRLDTYGYAIEYDHDRSIISGFGPTPIPEGLRYLIAISQLAEFLHQRATDQSHTLEWEKLGADCLEVFHLSQERPAELLEQMLVENVPLRPEL